MMLLICYDVDVLVEIKQEMQNHQSEVETLDFRVREYPHTCIVFLACRYVVT